MKSELLNKTRKLAAETRLPIKVISERTGLSGRWFHKFRKGEFENPGILTVQRLYDVLTGSNESQHIK